MKYTYDVTIVLPTFNEAENIGVLHGRLQAVLKDLNFEILVADDDSPDGTWAVGHELAREYGNVRVLRRVKRRGLTAACIDGAQAAMGRTIIVMDADLQHDEKIIPQLLALLDEDADIAIGSRFAEGGSADGLSSPLRQHLSRLGVRLTALLLGKQVSDPLTGFFAIRTEQFLRLIPKMSDTGFKLLFDLLYLDRSLKTAEVGFNFAERVKGESKLSSYIIWQFLTYLGEKLTLGILPARLISFGLIGLSGVAVHFAALLAYRSLMGGEPFWHGQLLATLIAMVTNFTLNNRLTFRDLRLRGRAYWRGLLIFAAASSLGIVGNVSVSQYIENIGSQGFVLSALVGILIDTIWKYAVARRIIWR